MVMLKYFMRSINNFITFLHIFYMRAFILIRHIEYKLHMLFNTIHFVEQILCSFKDLSNGRPRAINSLFIYNHTFAAYYI